MAKKGPPKLSPKLELELRDRLEELLDEHDDVNAKRRRVSKALRGHLEIVDNAIGLVRRQLKGDDLDQLEIPGTEKPEPSKDPVVAEILRIAGGIVEKQPVLEDEVDPDHLVGSRDEAIARHEKRPSALRWHEVLAGKTITAPFTGGRYVLEAATAGGWTAKRELDAGKDKLLVIAKPKEEAIAACLADYVERFADDMLKNAGSGDLTKGDLKGPAERFKKGGR